MRHNNYCSRMGKRVPVFLLMAAFFLAGHQSVAFADTFWGDSLEASLFINDRLHMLNNFFNGGEKTFDEDRTLHVLYVNPYLSATLGPRLQAVVEAEGQFTEDFTDDDFDSDIDLRNAYIRAAFPGINWLWIAAGQQALSTMGGHIYDDEAPAVRFKGDLERGFTWPLSFDISAARIEKNCPYVNAELKYSFAILESVSLSFGWFRDHDSGIARILNGFENERLYSSRGRIRWLGFSSRTFIGDFYLTTTFIYEKGRMALHKKGDGSRRLNAQGYLADISLEYSFSRGLSTGAFFYIASGDRKPESGKLKSFVSIDPYIDRTNIFFNGGIDSQFSSDTTSINGVQTLGVVAPGVSIDYRVTEALFIKSIFALLYTQRRQRGEGRAYGWEADFMGYYNLNRNFQFFAEFNFFKPGSYFRHLSNYRDHKITEFMCGISFYFSN